MSGIGYRQRLTPTGIMGAALGIGGPIVASFIVSDHAARVVTAAGNQYMTAPAFPVAGVAALSIASAVGWILVLVGREYYPVDFKDVCPELPSAAKKSASDG